MIVYSSQSNHFSYRRLSYIKNGVDRDLTFSHVKSYLKGLPSFDHCPSTESTAPPPSKRAKTVHSNEFTLAEQEPDDEQDQDLSERSAAQKKLKEEISDYQSMKLATQNEMACPLDFYAKEKAVFDNLWFKILEPEIVENSHDV